MRKYIGISIEVPEDVEQEQVDRDEDAEHRRLEREHEERERLDALVNRLPRRQQRQRRQEPGQDDQEQADAVDADVVLDAEHRHPVALLDELVVGAGRVELPPHHERRGEGHERRQQRDVAHQRLALGTVAAAAGKERQHGADEGKKYYERKHVSLDARSRGFRSTDTSQES